MGLRVFDWDLVSADDFLGQAELAFADVDPTVGAKIAPQWLPLYGWKGGKAGQQRIAAGEIQVAAWWQAGGSGPGQQGACTGLGARGSCRGAELSCRRAGPTCELTRAPARRSPGHHAQAAPRCPRCAASPAHASRFPWWSTARRAACMRSP